MKVFKSKIDWWILVILASSIVVSLFAAFAASKQPGIANIIIALIVALSGAGLPLWLLVGTRYTVTDQQLSIRCGPFSWSIPISSITAVTETRNPLSSPALSLDRLEINYENGQSVMVSPVTKTAFRQAIGYSE